MVECAGCGAEVKGRRARYCSRACANRHTVKRNQLPRPTCEHCGSTFRPSANTARRFCSKRCAGAWRSAHRKPRPSRRSRVWIKDCDRCGATFVGRSAQARWCSAPCRLGVESHKIVVLYHLAIEHGGSSSRWRVALCELLAKRDGPHCGICGEDVDLNLPSGPKGDDRGPSIDHIVPRSLGGADDLANLRLTHWACNRKRGNRAA